VHAEFLDEWVLRHVGDGSCRGGGSTRLLRHALALYDAGDARAAAAALARRQAQPLAAVPLFQVLN
jgi:hypothetical protein